MTTISPSKACEHKFPDTSDRPTHLNCLECDAFEGRVPYYYSSDSQPEDLQGYIYYCSDAKAAGYRNWLGGLGAVNAVPLPSNGCRMPCPRFKHGVSELRRPVMRQMTIFDLVGD